MWNYTDNVREHFLNPKNVGELADANAIGEVGSLACGDALKLFLRINDKGIIEDASFQTFGCASAIASSSVLTELVKGMHVDEAAKLSNKDIAEKLGGLPKEKMHCSVMGQEALEAALCSWRGENVPEHHEDELICKCYDITENQIRRAIQENGAASIEDITGITKAGGACTRCHEAIQDILDEALGRPRVELMDLRPKGMSNLKRMQGVLDILEHEVRPHLVRDGGDIELVDIDGQRVFVAFKGKCASCNSCSSHKLPLQEFVEKTLREHVDPEIIVKEVSI